jgi:hypothetical protein
MTFIRGLFPRKFGRIFRTSTDLLIKEYKRLFANARFSDLYRVEAAAPPCDLHVLSTRMDDGRRCVMDRKGASLGPSTMLEGDLDLSFAVACSSAFPPMFSPLLIDRSEFPQLGDTVYAVTDGGIVDNLGFESASIALAEAYEDVGEVIVSDASGPLKERTNRTFWWFFARLTRVTDILMNTISTARNEKIAVGDGSRRISHLSIQDRFDSVPGLALPAVVQKSVPYIRTDLDLFSHDEILALQCHGCGVAAKHAVGQPDARPIAADAAFYPVWAPEAASDANSLKGSERLKRRLFAWRDWAGYPPAAIALILLLYVTLGPVAIAYIIRDVEQTAAISADDVALWYHQAHNEGEELKLRLAKAEAMIATQARALNISSCTPSTAVIRYAVSTERSGQSEWKPEASSQPAFCREFIETLRASEPPGSVFRIAKSSEERQDSCLPFRCIEHRYACTVTVLREPIPQPSNETACAL